MTTHVKHDIHIAAGDHILVSVKGFEVPENRITVLLGESGIGKSLASKAVYGLLSADDLTIMIDGMPYEEYVQREEIVALRANSFFVFQEPSTHLNPLMTLGAQLDEGSLSIAPHQEEILDQLFETSADEDVRRLLEIYPKPYRPSGGEKQRMLLAMAFKKIDVLSADAYVQSRELFVFDEPTGSLDNHYRDLFLRMLFDRFQKQNFTVLLITHDYSMISRITESHNNLMHLVAFKELSLQRDGVTLRDFQPKDYLSWLDTQNPVVSSMASAPLLTIDPDVMVFGRPLRISRQKNSQEAEALVLHRGSIVYLKAPSGIGKTTIVKVVMGLLRADKVNARVDGLEINETTPRSFWRDNIWGKRIALVFQHADEALNPESTVKQVFAGLPSMKSAGEEDIKRVLAELFDVELDGSFLGKKVKYLSGGQKQRLNLLRGFSLNTEVLILDEPLNGLDFESGGKVTAMLQRKQREGKGILVISHSEEIFDRLVDKGCVYYLSAVQPPAV